METPNNRYIVVRNDFEVPTEAFYAQTAKEAFAKRADLGAGFDWRVYQLLD